MAAKITDCYVKGAGDGIRIVGDVDIEITGTTAISETGRGINLTTERLALAEAMAEAARAGATIEQMKERFDEPLGRHGITFDRIANGITAAATVAQAAAAALIGGS